MANVLSTLYPPLVDTFQSPFLYTEEPTISFTISPYNSYKEIKRIHVILVSQRTNQNMFASSNTANDGMVLTNGVWIVPFDIKTNEYLTGSYNNNRYNLKIPSFLLRQTAQQEKAGYACNYYYKVQLRFDCCEDEIDSLYINSKRAYFSEWSAVTLLKAIPENKVTLINFDKSDGSGVKVPQYNPGIIPIVGTVDFTPSSTGEYLKSFIIEVSDKDGNFVANSGNKFVEREANAFSWLCDLTNAPLNQDYNIDLYLTTNNSYTIYKQYKFRLSESNMLDFTPVWEFNKVNVPYNTADDRHTLIVSEDGWVTIKISTSNMLPSGYLYIKRASSLDQYTNWEIIDCKYFAAGQKISTTFIDKSVCSLVNYKYSCQFLTTNNMHSKTFKTNEIVYPDFHDILISRGDHQLAIRYNAQITNVTPTVDRTKVDTLGGKYPRFVQNARMNYKQFQITGTISAMSDYNRKFLSDADYMDAMSYYNYQQNGTYEVRNDSLIQGSFEDTPYKKFLIISDKGNTVLEETQNKINSLMSNTSHDIYPLNNWWWEREFREKAIEWLNDGEPKLYRSMTEGNMIVMVDAVSLTPNPQLGRMIWDFSATIYEVGDGNSLANLSSLGIVSINNDYNDVEIDSSKTFEVLAGQKHDYTAQSEGEDPTSLVNVSKNNFITADGTVAQPLIEEIQDAYKGYNENYQMKKNSIFLTDINLDFKSEPQWYNLNTMNLKIVDEENPQTIELSIGENKYTFDYNSTLKQYILRNES